MVILGIYCLLPLPAQGIVSLCSSLLPEGYLNPFGHPLDALLFHEEEVPTQENTTGKSDL